MFALPFVYTRCVANVLFLYICVANAGLLIHDGVGKYVLPSNHSVLVLSDRRQFGCHGEAWVFVCGHDCS